MKTNLKLFGILAGTAVLFATSACTGKSTESDNDGEKGMKTIQIADSVTVDSSKAVVKMNVNYPGCKCKTGEAIRTWIGRQFTYNYADNAQSVLFKADASSLSDVSAMAKLAADSILVTSKNEFKAEKDFARNYIYTYDVDSVYSTPTYLTYNFTVYTYAGGPHGAGVVVPATFSKNDGTQLTWANTFEADSKPALLDLIKNGLASQFFTGNDDWTLENALFDGPDALRLPSTAPSFDADGLKVIYKLYEVAPSAVGMPTCVLPLDSVAPYLTPDAKAILLPEDTK